MNFEFSPSEVRNSLAVFEKAFCGQAAVRSSAPRRGSDEVGLGTEPSGGHNSDCGDQYQERGQGRRVPESLGEGGEYEHGAAGEAGSILFASPSPAAALSLRPPRDPDADASSDAVREGRSQHPSLLASTGDGADEGNAGRGHVGCGAGVAEAARDSLGPRSQRNSCGFLKLASSQTPSNAEERGEDGRNLPHGSTTVPPSVHRLAAETAEVMEAAGAAGAAGAAEEAAEAGIAGAPEAAGATETAVEAGEDRREIRPGVAPGNKQYGCPSRDDASTRPGPAELARQGSARNASVAVAAEGNQGRNFGHERNENVSSRRRRSKPSCEIGGVGGSGDTGIGGSSGGQENSAKVDTEWENEIAKNILNLYQTKLKDELDKKRGAREEEAGVSLILIQVGEILHPYHG